MALAAILTGLSYRDAFIFLAIFLIASMSLILILMLMHPSLYPVWGFAGLTMLLALSMALMGWVFLHPEDAQETARD